MENTAQQLPQAPQQREDLEPRQDTDAVVAREPIEPAAPIQRDFVDEIEVWARRALASNGFGDF